jgi:hypothetical protein
VVRLGARSGRTAASDKPARTLKQRYGLYQLALLARRELLLDARANFRISNRGPLKVTATK